MKLLAVTSALTFTACVFATTDLARAAGTCGGCVPVGNTITVDTTTDDYNLIANGSCSLREAIRAANGALGLDTAADTIEPGVGLSYELTRRGTKADGGLA